MILHVEHYLGNVLSTKDVRWCSRYCKNIMYFSKGSRCFASTLVGAFAAEFKWEGEIVILNDELSFNVPGENHVYDWHLDGWAWQVIPSDAWALTVYVPMDSALAHDGGGWLRFRSKSDGQEDDQHFEPGDALLFDRWIWHKLVEFGDRKLPRAAYLIRITNSTDFIRPDLSAHSGVFPRFGYKSSNITSGGHLNHLCEPDEKNCRFTVREHDDCHVEYDRPKLALDAIALLESLNNEADVHVVQEIHDIIKHMCEHSTI